MGRATVSRLQDGHSWIRDGSLVPIPSRFWKPGPICRRSGRGHFTRGACGAGRTLAGSIAMERFFFSIGKPATSLASNTEPGQFSTAPWGQTAWIPPRHVLHGGHISSTWRCLDIHFNQDAILSCRITDNFIKGVHDGNHKSRISSRYRCNLTRNNRIEWCGRTRIGPRSSPSGAAFSASDTEPCLPKSRGRGQSPAAAGYGCGISKKMVGLAAQQGGRILRAGYLLCTATLPSFGRESSLVAPPAVGRRTNEISSLHLPFGISVAYQVF